jgi:hypothetical protein
MDGIEPGILWLKALAGQCTAQPADLPGVPVGMAAAAGNTSTEEHMAARIIKQNVARSFRAEFVRQGVVDIILHSNVRNCCGGAS